MKIKTYRYRISTQFLFFITLLLIGACNNLLAQTVNQWAWVSGDTVGGVLPVFGTKGTPALPNKPGGRNSASVWTTSGNPIWLFGGVGYGAAGNATSPNFMGDLWSYDTNTGLWTWVSGSTNTATIASQAVYGHRGVPAATNMPGQRYGCATWRDAAGNLWLFGGVGQGGVGNSGNLNDLWKFNITTKQWVWVRGDSTADIAGVYGTKGVEAAANKPGGRGFAHSWIDASGNFWFWGGDGIGSIAPPMGAVGPLNDMWKYNPVDSQWTWIGGTKLTSQPGVYGTLGTANVNNIPGGRDDAASWVDASGNLWVFGGWGNNNTTSVDYLNDLWQYNFSSGLWTWKGGSTAFNSPGVYGTKGVAAAANHPGARSGGTGWVDLNGDFWLMGGLGYDGSSVQGWLNDFMKYNIAANQWTWVSGDKVINQSGVYGSKNVSAATNKPGARDGQVTWTDANGNLWLFGGGAVYLTPYQTNVVQGGGFSTLANDLWGYQLNATVPVIGSFATLQVGLISFTAMPSGNKAILNWQAEQDPNNKAFIIQRSPDGTDWQSIGNSTAADHCSAACSYLFTDSHPLPVNYYRLQEISTGGQSQYSQVEKLNFSPDYKLRWYFTGARAITVQLLHGNREQYQLTGMDGRVWQKGVLQNGQVTFSHLPQGIYAMQVVTPAGNRSEKIMF